MEKQTRPRSTSPVFKSRPGRALSRSKSIQGKIITVQPAKKARKVEKEVPKKHKQEKEPASKKSKPTKQQSVQKAVSKRNLKKRVSLSESELELSELSDQALDISEEEKYFRVEQSPEPISLPEREIEGHRGVKSNKGREGKVNPEGFEDVIPGPPSMRHMRERIGRKLHEADQQMSSYRSGSPSWKTLFETARQETVDDRQRAQDNRRQQSTIGIQVDDGRKPSQVKSVGFFPSGVPEHGGTNVLKVSSSSQTDQVSSRPPVRRDLVTSGVQTEKGTIDSDHVTSHAPVLPPDIFLNLQMPKPDQEAQVGVDMVDISRELPHESVDGNQTVTDRPVSFRGRQRRAEIEHGDVPPATSRLPGASRGRQFLSVADIDHDQWLEVQSTPMTSADGIDEEKEERERDIVNEEAELPSRTGKIHSLCFFTGSLQATITDKSS